MLGASATAIATSVIALGRYHDRTDRSRGALVLRLLGGALGGDAMAAQVRSDMSPLHAGAPGHLGDIALRLFVQGREVVALEMGQDLALRVLELATFERGYRA